jgi:hypothetical protein
MINQRRTTVTARVFYCVAIPLWYTSNDLAGTPKSDY